MNLNFNLIKNTDLSQKHFCNIGAMDKESLGIEITFKILCNIFALNDKHVYQTK